jgi:hypothetical protein
VTARNKAANFFVVSIENFYGAEEELVVVKMKVGKYLMTLRDEKKICMALRSLKKIHMTPHNWMKICNTPRNTNFNPTPTT